MRNKTQNSDNPDEFEAAFFDFVQKESLINKGDTVIVAYSGGIDSSVLLHLMHIFKKEFAIKLIVAYFNHRLRGHESEDEEKFIKKTAVDYEILLEIGTGDVLAAAKERDLSTQVSARFLRYDFFQKSAEKYNADKIATGHNCDDQAETVLMRFLQGGGIKGMRGIPVRRESYIRPLLWARRSEITKYADSKGIRYFEDSSNVKTGYLRNRIRLEILPYLRKKLGTNLDRILLNHAQRFQNVYELIGDLTVQACDSSIVTCEKDKIILDIASFKGYFPILQQYVLSECFTKLGETDNSLNFLYALSALEFINGTFKRKHMYIFNGLCIYKDKSYVTIYRKHDRSFEQSVEIGRKYAFHDENFHFQSRVLGIDLDKVDFSMSGYKPAYKRWDEIIDRQKLVEPLALRTWKQGDKFKPLGMQQWKKLSDFFTDVKIPMHMKKQHPLLVDQKKIVWVCGLRIDDRVKVTENTKEIIGLKFTEV